MKRIYLRQPVNDGPKKYPAGTDVTDWPKSKLYGLRLAGFLSDSPLRAAADPVVDPVDDEVNDDPNVDDDPEVDDQTEDQTDDQTDVDDGAVTLDQLGLKKNELEAFASHEPPITTLGQAEAYFDEHGSFEPLSGIAKKTSDKLAIAFGLIDDPDNADVDDLESESESDDDSEAAAGDDEAEDLASDDSDEAAAGDDDEEDPATD